MSKISPEQKDEKNIHDGKEKRALLVDFKMLAKFVLVSTIIGFLLSLIFKLPPWLCVKIGAIVGVVGAVLWRSFRSAFSNKDD